MFVLCNVLASIIVAVIGGILGMDLLSDIFTLVLLVPSLAMTTRRLHDINKSGWWQLLFLIPFIGFIVLLVWLCIKGDVGPNQYGNPVAVAVVVPDMTPSMPSMMADEPAPPMSTIAEASTQEEKKTM